MKVGTTAGVRLLAAASILASFIAVTAVPASAAIDDFFSVSTTDLYGAGFVDFIDYGPGAPGGGNNDDYAVIGDYRADGHGVRAYAWVDGRYLGTKYNGNGYYSEVVWDPFGNVTADQDVGLKVCLVDGPNDTTPFACGEDTQNIYDG
jgi:hypothetical protein